ncbi:beta-1,4-galactosyltransferase 6-like isoform X1 [Mytilus californianus]|uniref:beta-1,4-galactosyltransferase 6-like isoform X1 n=1 Tax=Mytilus californianus TaxID=6549 RepID=UPI002245DFE2|nr:beta-1,4-galactosyltransferase 6-like isoform X1 [Mytilus californianus]XP_052074946.1 beta-1,4-galactosyltransferase 6-like isoform X1 [Mytilus californianus]
MGLSAKKIAGSCEGTYNACIIGLLVSATLVYALNLKFYHSISKIHGNMKNLSDIIQQTFSQTVSKRLIWTQLFHDRNFTNTLERCSWPPKYLHGRETLNRTVFDLEDLNEVFTFMKDGHYKPTNCTPKQRVAIIVPYRDREPQMKIFLNNVIPRIYRQQLEFGIYIVEQTSGVPFNRGMLSNIGFKEAILDMKYDCIVIHDLDILPEDDRNFYTCADNPIHMAVKVQQFKYNLPYKGFAGGVTTFSKLQYEKINGFSNQYFGWGGEDDDLFTRMKKNNYSLIRPFEEFGHCGSIKHQQANKKNDRLKILKYAHKIWQRDGLNNLKYNLLIKRLKQLYVWIYVNIDMLNVRKSLDIKLKNE